MAKSVWETLGIVQPKGKGGKAKPKGPPKKPLVTLTPTNRLETKKVGKRVEVKTHRGLTQPEFRDHVKRVSQAYPDAKIPPTVYDKLVKDYYPKPQKGQSFKDFSRQTAATNRSLNAHKGDVELDRGKDTLLERMADRQATMSMTGGGEKIPGRVIGWTAENYARHPGKMAKQDAAYVKDTVEGLVVGVPKMVLQTASPPKGETRGSIVKGFGKAIADDYSKTYGPAIRGDKKGFQKQQLAKGGGGGGLRVALDASVAVGGAGKVGGAAAIVTKAAAGKAAKATAKATGKAAPKWVDKPVVAPRPDIQIGPNRAKRRQDESDKLAPNLTKAAIHKIVDSRRAKKRGTGEVNGRPTIMAKETSRVPFRASQGERLRQKYIDAEKNYLAEGMRTNTGEAVADVRKTDRKATSRASTKKLRKGQRAVELEQRALEQRYLIQGRVDPDRPDWKGLGKSIGLSTPEGKAVAALKSRSIPPKVRAAAAAKHQADVTGGPLSGKDPGVTRVNARLRTEKPRAADAGIEWPEHVLDRRLKEAQAEVARSARALRQANKRGKQERSKDYKVRIAGLREDVNHDRRALRAEIDDEVGVTLTKQEADRIYKELVAEKAPEYAAARAAAKTEATARRRTSKSKVKAPDDAIPAKAKAAIEAADSWLDEDAPLTEAAKRKLIADERAKEAAIHDDDARTFGLFDPNEKLTPTTEVLPRMQRTRRQKDGLSPGVRKVTMPVQKGVGFRLAHPDGTVERFQTLDGALEKAGEMLDGERQAASGHIAKEYASALTAVNSLWRRQKAGSLDKAPFEAGGYTITKVRVFPKATQANKEGRAAQSKSYQESKAEIDAEEKAFKEQAREEAKLRAGVGEAKRVRDEVRKERLGEHHQNVVKPLHAKEYKAAQASYDAPVSKAEKRLAAAEQRLAKVEGRATTAKQGKAITKEGTDFLRVVREDAKRRNLPKEAGYVRSTEFTGSEFAPFAPGGAKATHKPKRYTGANRGREKWTPQMGIEDIAMSQKRQLQWPFVTKIFKNYAHPTFRGKEGLGVPGREVKMAHERWRANPDDPTGLDPDKWVAVYPSMLEQQMKKVDADPLALDDEASGIQDWAKVSSPVNEIPDNYLAAKALVLPKDVANRIQSEVWHGDGGRALMTGLRGFRMASSKVSLALFSPNPVWAASNVAGNSILGLMEYGPLAPYRLIKGHIEDAKLAPAMRKALNPMQQASQRLADVGTRPHMGSLGPKWFQKLEAAGYNRRRPLREFNNRWMHFENQASFTPFAKAEFFRKLGKSKAFIELDEATAKAMDGMRRLPLKDMGKLTEKQQLQLLKTHADEFTAAAESVHTVFGKWSVMSPKEQMVAGLFLGFYPFIRFSIQMLFTLPIRHPAQAAVYSSLQRKNKEEIALLLGYAPNFIEGLSVNTGFGQVDVKRLASGINAGTEAILGGGSGGSIARVTPPIYGPIRTAFTGKKTGSDFPAAGTPEKYSPWNNPDFFARTLLAESLKLPYVSRTIAKQGERGKERLDSLPGSRRPVKYKMPKRAAQNKRQIELDKQGAWDDTLLRSLIPLYPENAKRNKLMHEIYRPKPKGSTTGPTLGLPTLSVPTLDVPTLDAPTLGPISSAPAVKGQVAKQRESERLYANRPNKPPIKAAKKSTKKATAKSKVMLAAAKPSTKASSVVQAASPRTVTVASSGPPVSLGGNRKDLRSQARRAAKKYGIDPTTFERQIQAESGFNPKAGSPAGAQGIAQIMPGTAKSWGVNPSDPIASLDAAAKNMAKYIKKYGGWEKALAAYNAGEGAVAKYGGVPPYKETQTYIAKIIGDAAPPVSTASTDDGAADSGTTDGGAGGEALADVEKAIRLDYFVNKDKPNAMGRLVKDIAKARREAAAAGAASTDTAGGDLSGSVALGASGGWGGAQGAVESLTKGSPLTLTSSKRSTRNTASGNVSDHFSGNKNAYAEDRSGTPKQMLAEARRTARLLGIKNYRPGQIYNVTRNGVRYQLIYGTGDHMDHIHIGAKRA